jgi:hypothetical protein
MLVFCSVFSACSGTCNEPLYTSLYLETFRAPLSSILADSRLSRQEVWLSPFLDSDPKLELECQTLRHHCWHVVAISLLSGMETSLTGRRERERAGVPPISSRRPVRPIVLIYSSSTDRFGARYSCGVIKPRPSLLDSQSGVHQGGHKNKA